MSDPTEVFVKTNLNIAAILIFILTLWCMNHSITGASAFKGDLEELLGSGDGVDNCIGKVCLNGGTCLDSSNNDDQDLYNERLPFCSCVSGYIGEDCGISDATTDITGKIGSETTTDSKDTEVKENQLCVDKEIGIVIGAAGLCLLIVIIVLIMVVVLLCQRKRVQERETENLYESVRSSWLPKNTYESADQVNAECVVSVVPMKMTVNTNLDPSGHNGIRDYDFGRATYEKIRENNGAPHIYMHLQRQ